jgi:hypothetical protein
VHGAANFHDLLELLGTVIRGLLASSTTAQPPSCRERLFERSYAFFDSSKGHDSVAANCSLAIKNVANIIAPKSQGTVSEGGSIGWPHSAQGLEQCSTAIFVSPPPADAKYRRCRSNAFMSFARQSGNFLRL